MEDPYRRLTALLLISAADADGFIHPREEKIIRLGLGTPVYRAALEEYQAADPKARLFLEKEIKSLFEDDEAKSRALDLLRSIFLADGRYDPEEGHWMKTVWRRLTGE